MTEFIHLKNYGFLQTRLPTDLFTKLKKECQNDKKLKEMKSGLTGKGAPKHFYIEECFPELKKYVRYCAEAYEKKFKYIDTLKFLSKNAPLLVTRPWLNVQKRYEFLPMHDHDGILSYNIWIQIPYDIKKEVGVNGNASTLQFVYPKVDGTMGIHQFSVSKLEEGNVIMFPSLFVHTVCPFYTSEDVRLSVAGNILLEVK